MGIENTELYFGLVSLLRNLRSTCKCCMRRNPMNCERCDIRRAPELLEKLETTEGVMVKETDSSTFSERAQKIYEALKNADRPLMSSEIDISDICSYKQLKYTTLKSMAKNGVVSIGLNKAGHFVYAIKNKGNNNEDSSTRA